MIVRLIRRDFTVVLSVWTIILFSYFFVQGITLLIRHKRPLHLVLIYFTAIRSIYPGWYEDRKLGVIIHFNASNLYGGVIRVEAFWAFS